MQRVRAGQPTVQTVREFNAKAQHRIGPLGFNLTGDKLRRHVLRMAKARVLGSNAESCDRRVLFQIRMIERVPFKERRVHFQERFLLIGKPQRFDLILPVVSPRKRFMMIKIHVVADNIVIAEFENFKAKVNVIKGNREVLLVKAARLFEDFRPYHKARAGHRNHVSDAFVEAEIMHFLIAAVLELVNRAGMHVDNARVLDNIRVRI